MTLRPKLFPFGSWMTISGATRNASRMISFGLSSWCKMLWTSATSKLCPGTAIGGHRRREIALADFPYLYSRPRWHYPRGQGPPLIWVGLYPKTELCRSHRRNQHPRLNDCIDALQRESRPSNVAWRADNLVEHS